MGGSDTIGEYREEGQKGTALEDPGNTEANRGEFYKEGSHPQCQILGASPLFLRCLGRQLPRMPLGLNSGRSL